MSAPETDLSSLGIIDEDAYGQGFNDHEDYMGINPYKQGTLEFWSWEEGFTAAKFFERARSGELYL